MDSLRSVHIICAAFTFATERVYILRRGGEKCLPIHSSSTRQDVQYTRRWNGPLNQTNTSWSFAILIVVEIQYVRAQAHAHTLLTYKMQSITRHQALAVLFFDYCFYGRWDFHELRCNINESKSFQGRRCFDLCRPTIENVIDYTDHFSGLKWNQMRFTHDHFTIPKAYI